jgi:hypothetical protein
MRKRIFGGSCFFTVYKNAGVRFFDDLEAAGGAHAPRLVVDFEPVPEPSMFFLGALGVAGMCLIIRSKK